MSNIEKIRQEIERLYDGEAPKHDQQCEFEDGYFTGIATIAKFIDSLPEEKPSEDFPTSDEEVAKFLATHPKVEVPEKYKTPNWLFDKQPSDDLEEAAEEYFNKTYSHGSMDIKNDVTRDFIAGAEWQKEQMMKEAVEGVVCYGSKGAYVESDWLGTTDVEVYGDSGDKVKIVIIKDND